MKISEINDIKNLIIILKFLGIHLTFEKHQISPWDSEFFGSWDWWANEKRKL